MRDISREPLFERLGPAVLRVLALAAAALIVVPLALVAVLPFVG